MSVIEEITNENKMSQIGIKNAGIVANNYSNCFSLWKPSTWFSLTWTLNEFKIHELETEMLSCLKSSFKRFSVKLPRMNANIWTIGANTDINKTPIVFVHGFCGGIGLWIHNIDHIAQKRPFYAFDLLGFGRSSRLKFSKDPMEAENQFVQSIEEWREEMKINKMILLGHSFGGYLASSYALKYPKNIEKLILADPWGFPDPTVDVPFGGKPIPLFVKAIQQLLKVVNPLALFRASGQFGINMFKRVRPDFQQKYANLLSNEDLVYNYIYYANSFNPTGEEAFGVIAGQFGYSKNPMVNRFHELDEKLPVYFIFGAHSWIKSTHGHKAAARRPENSKTHIKIIDGAGHHVYADKPDEFNEHIDIVLEETNKIYDE